MKTSWHMKEGSHKSLFITEFYLYVICKTDKFIKQKQIRSCQMLGDRGIGSDWLIGIGFFLEWRKILHEIVVKFSLHSECTKYHWIELFKKINFAIMCIYYYVKHLHTWKNTVQYGIFYRSSFYICSNSLLSSPV